MLTPSGAFTYAHLNSNATTVLKAGVGMLNTVTVNTKGATGNTLTIYDNTAGNGTVIAVLDTTAALVTLTFQVAFLNGLTVVLATGTAADITVGYC